MERLSIDEIIEHCERKTKLYEEVGKCIDFETTELTDAIKEYWEHKQVKEYLEELKELRKIKEDYAKGMQTSYATFMYNKAIDDFKKIMTIEK